MAVANDKWNFIFLAEPHTASRATRDALLKLEGSYNAGSHHTDIKTLLHQRHLHRRKRSRYTTFCTVRNPADILTTLWLQLQPPYNLITCESEKRTFPDFIRYWGAERPETFFFRHATSADQTIRYENLQEDLNFLLRGLHAPSVRLGEVIGATRDKAPWFRYYTVADLRYILLGYPEIAHWGYSDEIYKQIDAKNRKLT
jgi:hypothetical protein